MATVSPFLSPPAPADSFASALDGLIAGLVGLNLVRRALGAVLEHGEGAGAAQTLLDEAYEEGRLSTEAYDLLTADINHGLGEDVPTEWSADLVNESAPGSDTLSPGETAPATYTGTTLQPGSVLLERFVLQARLDTTSTSDIFKAIDRHRQREHADNPWVALKLAIPGSPRYEDSLRLLRREASLARPLEHPHIVRIFDFDQDDGHAFLSMEWLDGESLADLLTRQRYRPLTAAYAVRILAEAGAALVHAHRHGITHGDVKPGNIFLARDGDTKLLDFGTARSSADEPQAADARTPVYASCEVLEGQPPTPQDDVYSLACVAYRMLAGRRPFGHHDALAAERAGRSPAPIRGLPASQSAALAHALAFRRSARTADITRFLAEFNARSPAMGTAAEVTTAVAPVPGAAPSAPRLARHSLSMPGPALVTAVTALVIAGLLAWLWRDEPLPMQQASTSPATAAPASPVVDRPAPAGAKPAAGPRPSATAVATPAPVSPPTAPASPVATTARQQAVAPAPAPAAAAPTVEPEPSPPPPMAAMVAAPATGTLQESGDRPATTESLAAAAAVETEGLTGQIPSPTTALITAGQDAAPMQAPHTAAVAAPASSGPRTVSLSDLQLRHYVSPLAPRMKRTGTDRSGWVEIGFVVGTDGQPYDVRIMASQPAAIYDQVALNAVRRWRFEPVVESGQPVERRSSVRLRFLPED